MNEVGEADLQHFKLGETMEDSLHFWVYFQFLVLTLMTNLEHKRKTTINFILHGVNRTTTLKCSEKDTFSQNTGSLVKLAGDPKC